MITRKEVEKIMVESGHSKMIVKWSGNVGDAVDKIMQALNEARDEGMTLQKKHFKENVRGVYTIDYHELQSVHSNEESAGKAKQLQENITNGDTHYVDKVVIHD